MTRIEELEDRLWNRHDWTVAAELAGLHVAAGRLDELVAVARALVDNGGDEPAWLDELLGTPERRARALAQLESRAGHDWEAAEDLAALLHHWNDIDRLRARAATGDSFAAGRAADWLTARGRSAEAIDILLAQAAREDHHSGAAARAVTLLVQEGRTGEARAVLIEQADSGDWAADERLVQLLMDDGDVAAVRARADAGSVHARERLAALLVPAAADELRGAGEGPGGGAGELRARAAAGDLHAARALATVLAEVGALDELRARAAAGDRAAAESLADALLARGDRAGAAGVLAAAAAAGDLLATERLIALQRDDPAPPAAGQASRSPSVTSR